MDPVHVTTTSIFVSPGPVLLLIIFFSISLTAAVLDVDTTVDSKLCVLANAKWMWKNIFANRDVSGKFTKNFSRENIPLYASKDQPIIMHTPERTHQGSILELSRRFPLVHSISECANCTHNNTVHLQLSTPTFSSPPWSTAEQPILPSQMCKHLAKGPAYV